MLQSVTLESPDKKMTPQEGCVQLTWWVILALDRHSCQSTSTDTTKLIIDEDKTAARWTHSNSCVRRQTPPFSADYNSFSIDKCIPMKICRLSFSWMCGSVRLESKKTFPSPPFSFEMDFQILHMPLCRAGLVLLLFTNLPLSTLTKGNLYLVIKYLSEKNEI